MSFIPQNISLPFFTYGLFKPNELCYYRIKDMIDSFKPDEMSGSLYMRDGIPFLICKENCSSIEGFTLHFADPKEAYNRIADIEPSKVYKWTEGVTVQGIKCNFLSGKSPDKGATPYDEHFSWRSLDDPYFNDAMEVVKEILDNHKDFKYDFKNLYRVQGAYMILWVSIERYAGLKYYLGKDAAANKVYQIAEEKVFIETLKEVVTREKTVYSAADLSPQKLLRDNPEKSIRFYYQVRSNIVHRGKGVHRDFDLVYESCKQLYEIFSKMLEDLFKGNRT